MPDMQDTEWVTERARALGFDLCGIAPAEAFSELARLSEWLERGFAGEMRYLRDPRRRDPANVLSAAKSVIVCALNYNTDRPSSADIPAGSNEDAPRGWISRYAWGEDYHGALGRKLERLTGALRERFSGSFAARWYVDTGPVHERVFAHHAGLGWLGKNTLLINETLGSFLFLGVILTTLELAPSRRAGDLPADLCGNCRLCLDACPTGALVEPYLMDARRCISYLTIELRGSIPEELRAAVGNHVFGCDVCQDVCPWNRRAPWSTIPAFEPRTLPGAETRTGSIETAAEETLWNPPLESLASISEAGFSRAFQGSAIRRAKWRGLLRNVCVALGNSAARLAPAARRRVAALLHRLADSPEESVSDCAHWAMRRIAAIEGASRAAVPPGTAL